MLGTAQVLVVDDDPAYRELVTTALTRQDDVAVETFGDPEAALSWASDRPSAIDCVVSDYEMPAMTGGALHDALRESGIDAPFVLISGADVEDIPPETAADAAAFVRKGSDSVAAIRSAVRDATDATRREQTLAALHGATERLIRADDRDAVAAVTVETAEEVLNFPGTGVRFYDPDREALVNVSVGGRSEAAADERPPFPVEGTHHGRAFRSGETVTYEPTADDPYDTGPFDRTMYVPIGEHGILSVGKTGEGPFGSLDVQFAETLAGHAATVLDRLERERTLERERDRLERVTSVVSHDLQNPLHAARGSIELASDEISDESALDHLSRAEHATERVAALLEDMVTLAEGGDRTGEIERVDLADAAERAWEMVETDGAELWLDPELGSVEAEPEALATVLENLLRNSVEHGVESSANEPNGMADGGESAATVRVGVEPTPEGFAVTDDGGGFPVDPERAFEWRFTTDDGTGLGLAIVRDVARTHGWEVRAHNEEAGARVEVVTDSTGPSASDI